MIQLINIAKKGFFIILLLATAKDTFAQNFEWIKTYGGKKEDEIHKFFNSGSKLYSYSLGSFQDTLELKSTKLGIPVSKNRYIWLAKSDSSGRFLWAKKIFGLSNFPFNSIFKNCLSDQYDNIYLTGSLSDGMLDSIRFNQQTPLISLAEGDRSFIIKLDSSGNFLWQNKIPNDYVMNIGISQNKILLFKYNHQSDFINSNKTYKTTKISLSTFDLNGNLINDIDLLGLRRYGNSGTIDVHMCPFTIDTIQNEITLLNHIRGDSLIFNNTILSYKLLYPDSYKKNCLTYFRFSLQNGTLQSHKLLFSDTFITPISIIHDIGGNRKAIILNKLKQYPGIDPFTGKQTLISHYFAYLYILDNENLTHSCISSPIDTSKQHFFQIHNVAYKDGFIYINGYSRSDNIFGGFYSYRKQGNYFFYKIDTLCNVMWQIRTGDSSGFGRSVVGYTFDKSKDVYFSQSFSKELLLNKRTYYANNNSTDFLIAKIHDYSITRGDVSKGPYCAGDTILIPFTKDGTFDSSNYFIAELSDEEGLFNGGHRELGRLKSYKDSTIIGQLPLLDVPTSPKYRIRIMSTEPQVQSYYRYDSLRLLIYSKDTANAGPDSTVCYGQSIQIKTSGGSRWQWSPGKMVKDSTARITTTLPIIQPTRFRIIISDSSGCGKIDTAYKWLYPLQPLKILNKDTTVCRVTATVIFQVSGGRPANYKYQWLDTLNTLLSSSKTLTYKDNTPTKLRMVLSDGCSSKNDSLLLNIKRYERLQLFFPKDTAYCGDLPVQFKSKAKGGKIPYHFTWHNAKDSIISTSDSITFTNRNQTSFKIKLKDACATHGDSIQTSIRLYVPITMALPNDTTICNNSTFTITPTLTKGIKSGPYRFDLYYNNKHDSIVGESLTRRYADTTRLTVTAQNHCNEKLQHQMTITVLPPLKLKGLQTIYSCKNMAIPVKINCTGGLNPLIKWLNESNQLVTQKNAIDTIIHVPSSTQLTFIAFDNCSEPNDTGTIAIIELPPLKSSLSSSPYCFKDTAHLSAKVSGGKPAQYLYEWHTNNTTLGNDTQLTYNTFNNQTTVYFTLKDNCSPPHTDSLVLLPMVKANFNINDVIQCIGDNQFVITNTSRVFDSTFLANWTLPPQMTVNTQTAALVSGRFNIDSQYRIALTVQSKGTCRDSISQTITVLSQPSLELVWHRITDTYDQSDWFFRAGSDRPIDRYNWSINHINHTGNPVYHHFTDTGWIPVQVRITDNEGCFTDSAFRYYLQHRLRFYIPNAITANGDGINDVFQIAGREFIREFEMRIFNRWGELVFKTYNPDEVWQPEFSGSGTYVYLITIFDTYNERHLLKGTITVLK